MKNIPETDGETNASHLHCSLCNCSSYELILLYYRMSPTRLLVYHQTSLNFVVLFFFSWFTWVTFLIFSTLTVIFIFSKDGKNYQLSPPRDVCVFDWLTSLRVRKRLNSYFKARAARLGLLSAKRKKISFLMLTDFARFPFMFTLKNCFAARGFAGSEEKAV